MGRIFNIATFIILLSLISYAAPQDCSKQNYLLLELNYKDGVITYSGHSLQNGCVSGSLNEGSFKIEVLDKGKVVYSSMFADPSKLFVDIGKDNSVTGGVVNLNNHKFYLVVPAVEEAKVKIYDKENILILNLDIQVKQSVTRSRNVGLFGWVDDLIKETLALLK